MGSGRDYGRDGPHDAALAGAYEEHGYSGLWDHRKRRPSPKRVPVEALEKVLQLYREQYFDFNVRHFHEKLRDEHGIQFSYTWVKTALQKAGLVRSGRSRVRIASGDRGGLSGMMLMAANTLVRRPASGRTNLHPR